MFFRSKSEKPDANKQPAAPAAAAPPAAAAVTAAPSANTMPSMSSAAPKPTTSDRASAPGQPSLTAQAQPAGRKDPAVAFSQAVSILMRAPQTRDMKIADIEWLLVPALKNQQIAIAEAKLKDSPGVVPVAVLLWATVSPDVERRMAADKSPVPHLEAADWKSGDIPWIVAALGPADILRTMIAQLVSGPLAGRRIRGRVAGANGTVSVQEFG